MKETSKRSQLVIVLVLVVAAGVAYWYANKPDDERIGRTVTQMIQQKVDTTEPFSKLHMKVQSVDVIHSEGNKYVGVAHINLNGQVNDVPVDILTDGDQVMMQIQPGGFAFIAPALIRVATP
jgi:hypothetical protein